MPLLQPFYCYFSCKTFWERRSPVLPCPYPYKLGLHGTLIVSCIGVLSATPYPALFLFQNCSILSQTKLGKISYEILSWKIIWDILNLDFLFAWMSAHLTALHCLRWCSLTVLVPVFLYGIVWWFSTSMILSEPFYNFLCNAVWLNFQLSN